MPGRIIAPITASVNAERKSEQGSEISTSAMPLSRKIIHIDMDAFFASVEQRDHPELRGQPVIVGGDPKGRGVVAACSYEARTFGVHSAMACARAQRLCPRAVFVKPRMERYQQVSRQVMALFYQYTTLVEPLSVDEAFLDVTCNHAGEPSATRIAQALRQTIHEATGLTASAGVSCNKFLAKIASGHNKPNGITVIPPDQALAFIGTLPVGKFYGVGGVTEKKMHNLGIRTGGDLLRFSRQELVTFFGRSGSFFYEIARGQDMRPVEPSRVRKSIGTETTFAEDIVELSKIVAIVSGLVHQVSLILEQKNTCGRTLTLKVRYSDFTTITRSCTSPHGFFAATEMLAQVPRLLTATDAGRRKIRLLGVTVSNLYDEKERKVSRCCQLPLPFPPGRFSGAPLTSAAATQSITR